MRHLKYMLLLFVALLTSACRDEAPELMNPNERQLLNTPSQVFESFWHGMNNSYVFWDIDPTDWDKVYDDYLPRFRELDKLETVKTETLQELYDEICKNLVDHHYVLQIYNPQASPEEVEEGDVWTWTYPGNDEVRARDYYHEPFYRKDLLSCIGKYESEGRISDFVMGENEAMYACSYNIDDGIIYLRLSAFMIYEAKRDDPNDTVLNAVDNYLRLVMETPEIKGVILDVRGNGGGYLNDSKYTLRPLIDKELLINYTRTKEGLGRFDYGPWVPSILAPAEEHRKVEAPIVVLADVNSVSMSEATAMAVSSFPNGCVVGERTFGGQGTLTGNYKLFYCGQIENYAVDIYTTTVVTKDVKGVIHEGVGIVPDIEVFYDEEAMKAGRDVQLDRAVQYIHTGE